MFSAQHNDVGNVKVRPTLGKEGETVRGSPSSWIPWQGAMDYACAPPGKKTRLKMTISNTLTVHSGRLLTTLTIRWTRLYMSAHSYAVTFHCILINTWLNQARTTLLITQDKKNTTLNTRKNKLVNSHILYLYKCKVQFKNVYNGCFKIKKVYSKNITLSTWICPFLKMPRQSTSLRPITASWMNRLSPANKKLQTVV